MDDIVSMGDSSVTLFLHPHFTYLVCYDSVESQIPHGSLTAIVGQVGSGKSSRLAAILGEMEITAGRVQVCVRRVQWVSIHHMCLAHVSHC